MVFGNMHEGDDAQWGVLGFSAQQQVYFGELNVAKTEHVSNLVRLLVNIYMKLVTLGLLRC